MTPCVVVSNCFCTAYARDVRGCANNLPPLLSEKLILPVCRVNSVCCTGQPNWIRLRGERGRTPQSGTRTRITAWPAQTRTEKQLSTNILPISWPAILIGRWGEVGGVGRGLRVGGCGKRGGQWRRTLPGNPLQLDLKKEKNKPEPPSRRC